MEIVQFFIHKHLTTKTCASHSNTRVAIVVNSRHDLALSLTCYFPFDISFCCCLCRLNLCKFLLLLLLLLPSTIFRRAAIIHQQVNVGICDLKYEPYNGYCAKIDSWKIHFQKCARHFFYRLFGINHIFFPLFSDLDLVK